MANLNPKRQAFVDKKKQKETGPFGINGYFPLFDTKEGAVSASPTPTENRPGENTYGYHIHDFGGPIFYMPNGLDINVTQFHGDWNGQIIPEVQIEQPPRVLSPKRRDFLARKEKLLSSGCLYDIVIFFDVSGSVGWPNGQFAIAHKNFANELINYFTPHMINNDLQMGFVTREMASPHNGIYHQTTSSKYLSNNPTELNTLVQGLTGNGSHAVEIGIEVGNNMLNKAQTDSIHCDLGNRDGQPGFKRILIHVTNTGPTYSSFPSGSYTEGANNYWQWQDIYGIATTGIGSAMGTSSSNAWVFPTDEVTARSEIQVISGTAGTSIGGDYNYTAFADANNLPLIAIDIANKICPPPPSWDCDGLGNCYDPGTGNGQYLSLTVCQASCFPPPSWDCDFQGNCYDPGTGNGQYSTLIDCQTNCFPPTWNCTPSGCVDPGDGTGQFSILQFSPYSCEAQCGWYECVYTGLPSPGVPGQSCVSHSGVAPMPLSLNQYTSLSACLTGCTGPVIPPLPVPNTWNCVVDTPIGGLPTYSCIDPLDGSGQYSSLVACQSNCGPQVQLVKESWNCDSTTSTCYDPGTGLGQYATLAACQALCKPEPPPPPIETTPSPPRRDTGY